MTTIYIIVKTDGDVLDSYDTVCRAFTDENEAKEQINMWTQEDKNQEEELLEAVRKHDVALDDYYAELKAFKAGIVDIEPVMPQYPDDLEYPDSYDKTTYRVVSCELIGE